MKKILFFFATCLLFNPEFVNAQIQLWGITSEGGQYAAGAIFSADSCGTNLSVQHNLFQYEGAKPLFSNLIQANNDLLYGMTYQGGVYNLGTLFQYNSTTNEYKKLLDFDGTNYGSKPFGSLLQASDGMLYGLTYKGGEYDLGVIFQYDIATKTYTKKLDFNGASNGRNPHRSLIQASDGNLYGLAVQGGVNDKGVLFQYNPNTSVYTKKFDFDSTSSGSSPLGDLMQASDGMLYGLTVDGGINNFGALFQYNITTDTFLKKIDFDGTTNGSVPLGSLIQANDGMLYALANRGGANNLGALVQYNPINATCSIKVNFDGTSNGRFPYGSLIQTSDGSIYGMTTLGGANDMGVLFQYNITNDSYNKQFDFSGQMNGNSPYGDLMQANNGKLYGMTNLGGVNDLGVLFQYDFTNSLFSKQLDFGAEDGRYSYGSLMRANDGNLYGTTNKGGRNNLGVLFKYTMQTATFDKLVDFTGDSSGSYPFGNLTQANDGMLYGLTYEGGSNDSGVLFQFNPNTNSYAVKFNFDGLTTGSYPHGSLLQVNDGNLYGVTSQGGLNNLGVLFKYDPITSSYLKLFDFDSTSGSIPLGDLMQANDGNLYGLTSAGGTNNVGTLFQYNSTANVFNKKFDFDGSLTGIAPEGSLVLAYDYMLYGLTNLGGVNNLGVLFQYNLATSTCVKELDFEGVNNGSNPKGSLILGSDSMLYGLTYNGGVNDGGVLFQYNPITNMCIKKIDYSDSIGKHPCGNLTEVNLNTTSLIPINNTSTSLSVYPNPNNGAFVLRSSVNGSYSLVNSLGQIVKSVLLNTTNNYTQSIDNISAGVYFIVGFNNNVVTKQKVLVIN